MNADSTRPRVDARRLIEDLETLRSFGASGTGVVRTAYSAQDMAARAWLVGRFKEAGLEAHIDGIGNVIGRSARPGPALLLGSHSDTQPRGGWLDGAMGVIYGLEVARALAECPATRDLAVDVNAWADEEGTYSGFIGVRSYCGFADADAIAAARDARGHRLLDALADAGLDGVERARLDADRQLAYLEAHIEQGGRLEASGRRIGVVTGIVGIRSFRILFRGQQNHAGTTPMPLRRDAGAACIALAHALQTGMGEAAGESSVWTVGALRLEPGAPSIIPGRAEMRFQCRDPDPAVLDRMEAFLRERTERAARDAPVDVELVAGDAVAPVAMDERLQAHLTAAAEELVPGGWMSMPSGAGHDAQVIARRIPAGMVFVPSIGGVSHDFAEDTAEQDIVLGCRVLAAAAVRVLTALGRSA